MARTAQSTVQRRTTHKLHNGGAINGTTINLEGDSGEVWQMYAVEGCTQQEIADHFGISQGRVSQIITKVRESIPQPDIKQIRNERLIQLRAIMVPFARKALAGDDMAARTYAKLAEREARILGYDAPVSLRQALDGAPTRYILELANFSDEELT